MVKKYVSKWWVMFGETFVYIQEVCCINKRNILIWTTPACQVDEEPAVVIDIVSCNLSRVPFDQFLEGRMTLPVHRKNLADAVYREVNRLVGHSRGQFSQAPVCHSINLEVGEIVLINFRYS